MGADKPYRYNEYYKLTQMRLRQYPYQKVAVENLKERIEDMQGRLEIAGAKIPQYGKEPVQTSLGASQTELAAESREQIEKDLAVAKRSYDRLSLLVRLTTRAIEALPKEDMEFIEKFYFLNYDYVSLTNHFKMSESTCRRGITGATKRVSYMIFGDLSEETVYAVQ